MSFPEYTEKGVSKEKLEKRMSKKPQEGRVMLKLGNPLIANPDGDYINDGRTFSGVGVEAYLGLDKKQADAIHKEAWNFVKSSTPKGSVDDVSVFQRELELALLHEWRERLQ